ncbi:MAG: radical SAM protein [Candidatus Thorarchaeota archaeon SMTZ1-83]|nr:MAG: hypothetical protein AM324_13415 [Candidatus Thorarchaeota archaeon SMTZ1-83]
MDPEHLLRLKIRLLTEGAVLPEGESSGRTGGAGPVGGRYFILPNGRPCGVPIRRGRIAKRFGSAPLTRTDDEGVWVYEGNVELRAVPRPSFYDRTTADGVPYHHIALLHAGSTLATTIYQACRYWDCRTQCKFCTIPTSHLRGDTVLEKSPSQIAEVVQAAEEEGVITDVLLTTGTPPNSEDMGGERLVAIISAIREFSDIPIGVQIEPPVGKGIIRDVARAGANAIGMHIESADESVREEMTPGKYEHGQLDLYRRSWQHALDYFDRGNVSTFLLHGLGENKAQTLDLVGELAEVGVLPIVAPVRPAKGSQLADYIPTYVGNLEESISLYKEVGRILYKWNLNPASTVAGCHRCGGCTPIQEAYDWAASVS